MSVLATVLITLAGGALPSAVIAGLFMLKVNRANAVHVLAQAEDVSRKTAIHEAESALQFAHGQLERLDKDYEQVRKDCDSCRAKLERMEARDERRDRIEDALIDAMLEAIPLLPADADQTRAVRAAVTTARQAKYEIYAGDQ